MKKPAATWSFSNVNHHGRRWKETRENQLMLTSIRVTTRVFIYVTISKKGANCQSTNLLLTRKEGGGRGEEVETFLRLLKCMAAQAVGFWIINYPSGIPWIYQLGIILAVLHGFCWNFPSYELLDCDRRKHVKLQVQWYMFRRRAQLSRTIPFKILFSGDTNWKLCNMLGYENRAFGCSFRSFHGAPQREANQSSSSLENLPLQSGIGKYPLPTNAIYLRE